MKLNLPSARDFGLLTLLLQKKTKKKQKKKWDEKKIAYKLEVRKRLDPKQGQQTKVACAWLIYFHEFKNVLCDVKLMSCVM